MKFLKERLERKIKEMSSTAKAIELIQSGDFTYVDDHVDYYTKIESPDGFIIYMNKICPLYFGHFCLNPILYNEEDKKNHLSTSSIGGTLYFTKSDTQIKNECRDYNARPFGQTSIERVYLIENGELREVQL